MNKPGVSAVVCICIALLSGCSRVANKPTAAPQASVPATTSPAQAGAHPAVSAPAGPPQTDNVPTQVYRDAATGVSLRYPVAWQVASPNNQNGYLPAAIGDSQGFQPRLNVVFSPDGNVYGKTNLQDLSFTYGVVTVAHAAACRDLVAQNTERSSPVKTAFVNGASFTEIQGGDAAMSHRLAFTLDSAWHNGACLVFEQDEASLAPGVEPGKRELTGAEQSALQRHLRDVFTSVTLQ